MLPERSPRLSHSDRAINLAMPPRCLSIPFMGIVRLNRLEAGSDDP